VEEEEEEEEEEGGNEVAFLAIKPAVRKLNLTSSSLD
jgi:hypothetical protein